jgi:hypothetical protein
MGSLDRHPDKRGVSITKVVDPEHRGVRYIAAATELPAADLLASTPLR